MVRGNVCLHHMVAVEGYHGYVTQGCSGRAVPSRRFRNDVVDMGTDRDQHLGLGNVMYRRKRRRGRRRYRQALSSSLPEHASQVRLKPMRSTTRPRHRPYPHAHHTIHPIIQSYKHQITDSYPTFRILLEQLDPSRAPELHAQSRDLEQSTAVYSCLQLSTAVYSCLEQSRAV